MSKSIDTRKFRVAIGALLLLISMQFAAIAHANEHALNSTDQVCIIHLELSQFSNLIPSDSIVLPLPTKFIETNVLNQSIYFPLLTTNYSSRAPPSFK